MKDSKSLDLKKFYLTNDQVIPGHSIDQKKIYTGRCNNFKENPIGFKKIVFLGDSITEGGNWNKYCNTENIVNRGIGGDTTEGILARLEEIYYYQPIAVFLLVGINDIFNTDFPGRDNVSSAYVAKNILLIANKISENSQSTKLYIQTILPINQEVYTEIRGDFPVHSIPISTKINKINSLIKDMCKKNNLIQSIDLNSIFKNETGQLKRDYTEDGVHLNKKGYRAWTKRIRADVPLLNNLNN